KIEITWAVVFPAFQCPYVTTNTVSVLLNYCPRSPECARAAQELGFVGVQWTGYTESKSSCATARRMVQTGRCDAVDLSAV
ncbi:hypothetical protein BJV74DRAFT_773232, partial [Russula compacta]